MWPWIAIAALFLMSPWLLRTWARYRSRQNLVRYPVYQASYSEAPVDAVPPNLRDALATASAELTSLGFEFVGFMMVQEPGFPAARISAILLHRVERTIANVAFSIGDRRGVIVDFETLYTDGWWLRTINRRKHFILAPHDTGSVRDPYVATLADQWQYHHEATAGETARERREIDLQGFLRHKIAVQADEAAVSLRQGLCRASATEGGFRFTWQAAGLTIQRVTDAHARAATAPPVTGVLAMRCPPDDLEIKYQNIRHAQRPHPRTRWAFLVSVIAFAASALLFRHWAWLLWLIPFLLLHEIGHWGAMRMFGHRDATIRFIPFLGAATLSTTQFRKLSHEMIVLLAGPVPGIVLGLAIFQIVDFSQFPYALWTAITLIAINGINLLPLHPLDGGRILHALVTAGRPRLDLALKTTAGALFLVGAIRMQDPTLAILAVVGFLVVRPGLRLARIESEIRRRPGFGPGLSPEERRRIIFEALPDPPRNEGNGWVQVVQQIEVPLSHETPRLGPALPWGLLYAACLGGLVAWSVNVFAVIPRASGRCPPRSRAMTLACSAPADASDIDWSRRDPDSITRNPFKLRARPDFPFAAFVWCTGSTDATAGVAHHMRQLRVANAFCPAPAWEALPPETQAQRENARSTLEMISFGVRVPKEEQLAHIDRLASRSPLPKTWDAETARLYKAWLDSGPGSETHRLLSERIGKSPSDSCKRLRIVDVVVEGGRRADDDEETDGDEAGAVPPGPSSDTTALTTRLSVMFAAPADFAPLRRYLCDAGCQVDVLPYGSMDPRLRACF